MNRDELRAWRLARGWTQEEAGLWYGLSMASAGRTWRRWELGERGIPSPLVKAVKRFNVNSGTSRFPS